MKIKLYKKAPKCPKCKIPMKFENKSYSDALQKKIDCKHKWLLEKKEKKQYDTTKYWYFEKCEKCGETRMVDEEERKFNHVSFTYCYNADIYRCPKCLDLYKVEE